MLTPEQRTQFEQEGFVKLPAAVDPELVAEMRDAVWKRAAAVVGVHRDRPETWKRVSPRYVRSISKAGGFDAMCSPALRAALDELLGPDGWSKPRQAGQLLMNEPSPGEWDVPHKQWHFDFAAPSAAERLPGAQAFVFLDRVEPRGGGTLAIAGIHRLVEQVRRAAGPRYEGRSAELRRDLKRVVPWLRALTTLRSGEDRVARFMTPSDCDGVELRVVEFCGEPGDAVLMHCWLMHAGAPNRGTQPRIVLTERFRRSGSASGRDR